MRDDDGPGVAYDGVTENDDRGLELAERETPDDWVGPDPRDEEPFAVEEPEPR